MAGDWLLIQHDTPDKPEIMQLSKILKCSVGDAFLYCFRIWRWADKQSYDGNVDGVTFASLDAHIGVAGFSEALSAVGWLIQTDNGLKFPKFDKHISKSAKTRELTAKRQKRFRDKNNANSNADSVTFSLPQNRIEYINTPLPPEGGKERWELDLDFMRFWEVYPKKHAPGTAWLVWCEIQPSRETIEEIISAVRLFSESAKWKERDGQYIPKPPKFLRERQWQSPPSNNGHIETQQEILAKYERPK